MIAARIRWALLAFAGLAAAVTCYYGIIFTGQLPDHRSLHGYNDWFLHSVAFFVLSLPLLLIWRWSSVLPALTLLALGIKAAQLFVPRRNPGLNDVLAGALGILAGICVIFMSRTVLTFVRR